MNRILSLVLVLLVGCNRDTELPDFGLLKDLTFSSHGSEHIGYVDMDIEAAVNNLKSSAPKDYYYALSDSRNIKTGKWLSQHSFENHVWTITAQEEQVGKVEIIVTKRH